MPWEVVLEGKILTYFAKDAFGRWPCAEGNRQVVDLREFVEKGTTPMPVDGPVSRQEDVVESGPTAS